MLGLAPRPTAAESFKAELGRQFLRALQVILLRVRFEHHHLSSPTLSISTGQNTEAQRREWSPEPETKQL